MASLMAPNKTSFLLNKIVVPATSLLLNNFYCCRGKKNGPLTAELLGDYEECCFQEFNEWHTTSNLGPFQGYNYLISE